jgi:hypothetical protein
MITIIAKGTIEQRVEYLKKSGRSSEGFLFPVREL